MNISNFQSKISQASHPVVVDFWAPWCAPCRATKPILEKLARTYAGKVELIPINADEAPGLVQQFGILGIPTVLAFQGGVETGRVTGVQSESSYAALFQALAEGRQVEFSLPSFNRLLRLGAGASLVLVGFLTSNWLVLILGSLLAFLGVYDRCPVWKAISGGLKKRIRVQQ